MENEEVSLKSKILRAIDMPEQAEVLALKSEVSELKETIASMQTEFSEALKSMQEEFTQTLTEALKPVDEVAEKSEDVEAEPEPTVIPNRKRTRKRSIQSNERRYEYC